MRDVDAGTLLAALEGIDPSHPAHLLVPTDTDLADIEEAAAGDPEATDRTLRRRNVSRDEVEAARERASETGLEGEAIVDHYLAQQQEAGRLTSWNWVAEENALSPYDFRAEDVQGRHIHIEVKTTTANAPRPFHISLAELAAAANVERYDLYRVSALSDGAGVLRRSESIGPWAKQVVAAVNTMPPGVVPQTFLVREDLFTWSEPEPVELPSDDGEDA
jgi:hypothetical protein